MTSTLDTLGVGIVGMGFMGQTHARAYLNAIAGGANARLVGVCDRDPERRSGIASGTGNIEPGSQPERLFDPGEVDGHEELDALLSDPDIGLVSVCTPTDSHVTIAQRALEAGKHVLVEKPVALDTGSIQRLAQAAQDADRLCIPAMCMRHWPGWRDLRTIIRSNAHGAVRHARFERLGSMPAWGTEFYTDRARSGGAIFDLHVHDADMVLALFGRPTAVTAAGDDRHVSTRYDYGNGPAVSATGGWLSDPSFPFSMRFLIEFEHAVLTYDSAREQPLTLHRDGQARAPELDSGTGYDHQASAALRACAGEPGEIPTLNDALDVTRMILAERDSCEQNTPVTIDW